MPLGNIESTLLTLLMGTPEIHWIFEYRNNESCFIFDDQPIKETLDGIPLSEPAVMKYIREMIEIGIQEARLSGIMEATH
jgi:hypothetical protein